MRSLPLTAATLSVLTAGCGSFTRSARGPDDVDCQPYQLVAPANPRPANWEVPVPGKHPGLKNLFEVVPHVLYRGAQPESQGWQELQNMGIKTVVSLRMFHTDALPPGSPLQRVKIGSSPAHPEDEDMVRFLKVATDPKQQPVFVHCMRGVDRTGTAVAIYRMAVQGWTADQAVDEMVRGGTLFDCKWMDNPAYLKRVDINRIRRAAGLQPGPP